MLETREAEIVFNGGLDIKDAIEIEPAETGFRELSGYRYGGQVGRLERTPMPGSSVSLVVPGTGTTTPPHSLVNRGNEICVLTERYGLGKLINDAGVPAVQYLSAQRTAGGTVDPALLTMATIPADVSRKILYSSLQSKRDKGIVTATACLCQNGNDYVAAWVEYGDPTGAKLFLRAYALDNDTEIDRASVVVALPATSNYALSSCAITQVGLEGAVVTYADTNNFPGDTPIIGFHYDQATRTWATSVGLYLASPSSGWAHRVEAYTGGGFLLGAISPAGLLHVQHMQLSGPIAAYTAATACIAAPAFAVAGAQLAVYSIESTTQCRVHYNPFGGVSTAVVNTTGATEPFITVTASSEPQAGVSDAAAVWLGIRDLTIASVDSQKVRYVSYDANTKNSLYTRDIPNCLPMGCVTNDDRSHIPLVKYQADSQLTTVLFCRTAPTSSLGLVPDHTGPRVVDPVARLLHDRASGRAAAYNLGISSTFVAADDTVYFVSFADQSTDSMAGPNAVVPQTVALCKVRLAGACLPVDFAQDRETTLIAGGVLCDYDGIRATEAQPLTRPVCRVASGAVPDQYACAVYSWVDAAGKLHRSEPSAPIPHQSGTTVYVEVPTVTALDGTSTQEIAVELYTGDGVLFYLANTVGGYADHYDSISASGDFYLFNTVLLYSDANPPLYTNGGELASAPPPSLHSITMVGDVVFAVDAEDRSRWWRSKPLVSGYAVEWNTALTGNVGDTLVRFVDMNGTPTLLCTDGVYQLPGSGPNAFGVGAYAPPVKLSPLGCASKNSVCVTPHGVVYQSPRGFALLTQNLQVQEIGQPVEPDTNPRRLTLRRVVYDAARDELRAHGLFATGGVRRYFFSFANGAWSRESLTGARQIYDAIAMADARSFVARANNTNDLLAEDATASADTQTFTTPWVKLAEIAGFARLWRIMLALRSPQLGNIGADYTLQVRLYIDFNDATPITTYSFDSTKLSLWPTNSVQRLMLLPRIQRARAIKLTVIGSGIAQHSGITPLSLKLKYAYDPSKRANASRRASP